MVDDASDWLFDYNLSDKIEYLDKITSSSTFEIKLEEKFITGFRITIRDSTFEEAQSKSFNKANNLKNYLIIKSGCLLMFS